MSNSLIRFKSAPSLLGSYSVVGSKEGKGPLGQCFDTVFKDSLLGEKTWEMAESSMQQRALDGALATAEITATEIDCILGGDLLNQCTATAYAVRETSLPFLGLYGACSTCAEGHIIAAAAIDGGFAERVATVASSHFCSAERQFRFPLEYGGLRTPTAQWTATAAGAFVFAKHSKPPFVTVATVGRIVDMGVTDLCNMGAAMAPAATDTLCRFFKASETMPSDYSAIVTGDLGFIGSELFRELTEREGYSLGDRHFDCGKLLYERNKQDVHSGGSGAGCSAAVMSAYFLQKIATGELSRLLFIATGALMSPLRINQGESIPSIAHLVCFEHQSEVL